jgi:uncharacterized membrane protein
MKSFVPKMNFLFRRCMLLLSFILLNLSAAVASETDPFANWLRESNKLMAVIAVLLTIFAGIIFFLIYQERKIRKIENQINQHKQ